MSGSIAGGWNLCEHVGSRRAYTRTESSCSLVGDPWLTYLGQVQECLERPSDSWLNLTGCVWIIRKSCVLCIVNVFLSFFEQFQRALSIAIIMQLECFPRFRPKVLKQKALGSRVKMPWPGASPTSGHLGAGAGFHLLHLP